MLLSTVTLLQCSYLHDRPGALACAPYCSTGGSVVAIEASYFEAAI